MKSEDYKIKSSKQSFQIKYICREIGAYFELLSSLLTIGQSLVENHKKCKSTSLFSEVGTYENTIRKTMENINLESFYGRVFAFHVKY